LDVPKQRRARIRLSAAERSELERRVAARASTQQAAYRAEINWARDWAEHHIKIV
jgi:hypothetical protein